MRIHAAGRWLARLLGPAPEYAMIIQHGSRLGVMDLGLPALNGENAQALER